MCIEFASIILSNGKYSMYQITKVIVSIIGIAVQ